MPLPARPLLTLAALAGTVALSGCGTGATPSSAAGSAVPDGVAEQHRALAAEVAERGGSTTAGEWTVSYIVEQAEPWFHERGGHQRFREPATDETHHIEIIPTETGTGRIVPDVPITLEVVDASGRVVDARRLGFYHSTFFHYANNFAVPEDGRYTLRAELGTPSFRRHGEQVQKPAQKPALSRGTSVSFDEVELTGD